MSEGWCGRGDSNPHVLASASPSSWCVCQFRHFRVTCDRTSAAWQPPVLLRLLRRRRGRLRGRGRLRRRLRRGGLRSRGRGRRGRLHRLGQRHRAEHRGRTPLADHRQRERAHYEQSSADPRDLRQQRRAGAGAKRRLAAAAAKSRRDIAALPCWMSTTSIRTRQVST